MALLASKNPIPAPFGPATHSANTPQTTYPPSRRPPAVPMASQSFASPTEADFSDDDGPDSVRNWDEEQVCAYLRSVKCGDYERLFRRNHINGENLLEMDKEVLKEIGVDKVGDRVRLFVCIKKLRTKAYGSQKKRNRDSFVSLDTQFAPSSNSPRPFHSGNSNWTAMPSANSKRYSRQYDSSAHIDTSKNSRPPSPLSSGGRQRHAQPQGYGSQSTISTSSRFPMSPPDSSHSARTQHTRNNSSVDGSLMAALPQGQGVIRVISTGGVTKVVKVADCKNCAEVMRLTLRKFALREDHERNYCFWILNGTEPDPKHCQPVGDKELWNIINDQNRPERNRLMLRRVPAGCPGQAELERAAEIALEEQQSKNQSHGMVPLENRSQLKVQKILGEKWDTMQQPPLSPVSYEDRERNVYNTARDLERPAPSPSPRAIPRRKQQLRQFGGLRPPSELIASDLTSYFPDHSREKIDQTARLSMRRSARLSKFNHRLSVASTLSFASSIQDAPPIPQIAGNWLTASNQVAKIRPRDPAGRSPLGYRDSVTSSVLDPLQEESSPIEPNRKSYVSFADSGSDTAAVSVTDPDGNVVRQSYYDGDSTLGSGGSGSYEEVSQALNEEGEDADEELRSFLAGESWDDNKWMKGALIGQGSFGSVYLALHAITGELLAVKQVEAPSPGSNGSTDSRKKSMIDALKREISLLRDLRHPNIVQYLGCGTSAEYLNIFLEYVPGGSVQTMLNSYGSLPEPLVRSFVRQILNGLSYLHSRDIIHRDIKGANILVDNKGTVKISDFGISKKLEASNILQGANNNKNRPSMQGSVFWMAPEVVKQTSYTRKADIWSLGCLVVEMMTGTHPFPDCSQLQAIFKIGGAKASPTIPEHASQEAKQFLAQTFEMDYNKRPSADELMLSPFLTPPA